VAGVYSVTVTTLSTGCSNVASVTISSNTTAPTVSLSVDGSATCNNQVIVLTATSSQAGSYAFDGPGLDQTSTRSTANIRQPGTYTVVVTATNGCVGRATLTLAPPSLSLSIAGSRTVCVNQNTQLTASGASSYLWSTGAATARVTVRPTSTTSAMALSVTGTSGACVAVQSVTLTVNNCLAREAVESVLEPLVVRVLGNPTVGELVEVEIEGALGQPLWLQLTDVRGQQVHEQRVESASGTERRMVHLGRQAGVYLLQVSTPSQAKTVKIVRQ